FDDVFDPEGFAVEAAELAGLDSVFLWTLHTARAALRDAGASQTERCGAIFGNLSFPSLGMARYAESVWLGDVLDVAPVDPRNRFSSGLPALLLERALRLGRGACALDAACASSLYAIKLACDRLHDGDADLMLAGATNCADDLFIHIGFSALSALSRTGRSRPFHAEADGLVPAEGSAFVALKRLRDAERDGDAIHGVLRGVGLSNDGRGRGFLVPSREGQVRALREAYRQSGVRPGDVQLLECHATGTQVGDATELASLAEVFPADGQTVPLGSLKSNLGHLISAAGAAALIKVTEAMAAEVMPPSLWADRPLEEFGNVPFRLLSKAEPWQTDDVRRAGVSAFGFGGNNAHLVVEEYAPNDVLGVVAGRRARSEEPVALVGVGLVAADATGRAEVLQRLFQGDGPAPAKSIGVDVAALAVPPNDLKQTLGQQLAMVVAGQEASDGVRFERESTGLFVGMGVDAEVARYGLRWRLAELFPDWTEEALATAREAVIPQLEAAGVIGTMPNIPANRLNRLLDAGGPSCTVSCEEASGLEALRLAVRALQAGELDAALVGAVDFSCEPVHERARAACTGEALPAGDAAVALFLKRLGDARRDGDVVYAMVEQPRVHLGSGSSPSARVATESFGHSHVADSLLNIALESLCLHHNVRASGAPQLDVSLRSAEESRLPLGGLCERSLTLREPLHSATRSEVAPLFHLFEGADRAEVLDRLRAGETSGPQSRARARLVVVARDEETFVQRRERAIAHLEQGAPPGAGVHFHERPVVGELAFVYSSAGSAYRGMGRELLAALPGLGRRLAERIPGLLEAGAWMWQPGESAPSNSERLWGASVLSQLHTELTRHMLGLSPQAAIGYSSGETNSLIGLGAWTDGDAMRRQIEELGLYEPELSGSMDAVARAWGVPSGTPRWAVWNVLAPLSRIKELIAGEERVHLAIVHTDNDAVIAGDSSGCDRVLEGLGGATRYRLDYDMACHVPEVEAYRDEWLAIHRRRVTPVQGVRFYSAGLSEAYEPETERCAQAILEQACSTLDFRRVVERAYDDGVRVFVEHGPRGACSRWIQQTLEGRGEPVLSVSLDREGGGVEASLEAVAQLLAAGVELEVQALEASYRAHVEVADALEKRASSKRATSATTLRLAAHPEPVQPTEWPLEERPSEEPVVSTSKDPTMPVAPVLPSVFDASLPALTRTWDVPSPSANAAVSSAPAPAPAPAASASAPTSPEPAVSGQPAPLDPVVEGPALVSPVLDSAAFDHPVAQHLAMIQQVHREFLDQQHRLHQQFLASQGLAAPTPPSAPMTAPGAETAKILSFEPGAPQPPADASPAPPPVAAEGSVARATSAPVVEAEVERAPAELSLRTPTGLTLDRSQLEVHASGKISTIYGPLFAEQDDYAVQVRMPEPPLLLADRVTGIDAEPGVHGTGVLWSETDVTENSWYLHRGRMPAGVLIESGQADLMLISYMGADLLNKGERAYRLLGCQLTYQDDLPQPGDTLQYEIHVDGHAQQDDVRLFFFHYDCVVDGKPRIKVRGGQAGFFSEAELAESAGVLWTPEEQEIVGEPHLDPPTVACRKTAFGRSDLEAYAEGRAFDCFGEGFELAQTHTLSPAIQTGDMLFLDEVTDFDPQGGPWGRGYLRAEAPVSPDDWYFDGHFKNDPCMPGTLMFEGCLQALAFYQGAMGFTLERDGWRFQPVKNEPIDMRCRGQVTPAAQRVVYEVFVEEVVAGPIPTVYADLLCTVDGLKAFHARRAGLQLVPSWPLEGKPELRELEAAQNFPGPVATTAGTGRDEFAFDYDSLLACAWGRPSKAFGPMYERFDGPLRVPRLPGPPYHFLSRVTSTSGPIGGMEVGSRVTVEYDVPPDAWYFDDNGARTMPFAVLLEAALQPCGWLASYIGSALESEGELAFRNLDGKGTLLEEILDGAGPLRTEVELTNISQSAGMIIVSFDVGCFLGDRLVYDLETVFGFFPPEALANQVGLSISDRDRELCERPSDVRIDLRDQPELYYGGSARLGSGRLSMLHEVTGRWEDEGVVSYRAERLIDAEDWYFKSHFFQDPVQPGSLGLEAMVQLLQFVMLEEGMAEGMEEPRFEPLALDAELLWKYRGQVTPQKERVTVTLEITEAGRDERGAFALATSSLWCDGIRIYSAENLGMRLVEGAPPQVERSPQGEERSVEEQPAEQGLKDETRRFTETLDPGVDTWLTDHCPTWNRPALPMMVVVDRLAAAAAAAGPQGSEVIAVRDVRIQGWIDFEGARTLATEVVMRGDGQMLVRLVEASDGYELASGRIELGAFSEPPAALPQLEGERHDDLYSEGATFHGPAFQLLTDAVWGVGGSSSRLDAGLGTVPRSLLHPALLDAALHSIPHDHLHLWDARVPENLVAYPARVVELRLFDRAPLAGEVRCEVRFNGFLAEPQLPRFTVQWIRKDRVWAELDLVETCFEKGPLGSAEPSERRRFLLDRSFVPGLRLSRADGDSTRLSAKEVASTDWMPGTVKGIYGTDDVAEIAVREHLAQRLEKHPGRLSASETEGALLEVLREGDEVVVSDVPCFDPSSCREPWAERLGLHEPWLGRDLMEGLLARYVGRFHVEDAEDFARLKGRGALYLANHQVQIESILVTHVLSAFSGVPVTTVANAKHETRWIGWLLGRLFGYPGVPDPGVIRYFDQSDPGSMLGILGRLAPEMVRGERSFFAHSAGTRSQRSGDPVQQLSSVFLDTAVNNDLPVVPVRFLGGLPHEPIEGKLEFPVGHGAQDYLVGRAIPASEIAELPYRERRDFVLEAMNSLGPPLELDAPSAQDLEFSERVAQWQESAGVGEVEAVFFRVLEDVAEPSEETQRLLDGAASGSLRIDDTERDLWLADVARRLLGPEGPQIVG
ncbi:MAG: beta-ketoacyl synthase N-terminal-like domain-containing protein, partial [Acidobacteriota bacterium]